MTTELEHRPDIDEADLEYRPLSLLAVFGLILGLFSVVAIVAPPGWIVPAAGALASAIAILRINSNQNRLAGRGVAVIGLCLSLWLGTWAPTKYFVDRYYLAAQARAFTVEWLEAIMQNELEKAHQGTLQFRYRQPHNTDLKQHYSTSEIDKSDMQEYFAQGVIKELVGRAPNTKIDKMRVRTITKEKDAYSVVFIVEAEPPDDDAIFLAIEALREEHNDNFYWRVSGAADPFVLYGEEA